MFSKKKSKRKKNGNLHCGKKTGDLQIIRSALNGFGFLSVTNYESLVGPSKYIPKMKLKATTDKVRPCCSKFVQLELLNKAMARTPKNRAA